MTQEYKQEYKGFTIIYDPHNWCGPYSIEDSHSDSDFCFYSLEDAKKFVDEELT